VGFDHFTWAKVRSPGQYRITESVHELASVFVFDDQSIDANSTITALANWHRRYFHIEEVSTYKRLSVLDAGERGHRSVSFLLFLGIALTGCPASDMVA